MTFPAGGSAARAEPVGTATRTIAETSGVMRAECVTGHLDAQGFCPFPFSFASVSPKKEMSFFRGRKSDITLATNK
jgi:hypothetical protein